MGFMGDHHRGGCEMRIKRQVLEVYKGWDLRGKLKVLLRNAQ
jgi:hypothetical protein